MALFARNGGEKLAKQKLLLVDGHALAFRAFYALPELNAPDGTPTNAVLGFVNMLLKVLNDEKPTHVAVVFDAKGETFRHQAYREYKAGRQPAPDAFKVQLPLIKELVALLGLPLLEIEGVEADDVIASAALRAASSGLEASILTADKDLMQILAPGIRVIKPSKGVSDFKVYDAETFTEEYGFPPQAFVDYLALVGDKVDNVPGVPGIGDKRASSLLREYGSVEGIFEHLNELPSSLKEKIEPLRDRILESRGLMKLEADLPVEVESFLPKEPDIEGLKALCRKLGLKKLAERLKIEIDDPKKSEERSIATEPAPQNSSIDELAGEDELVIAWQGEGAYPKRFAIKKLLISSRDGRHFFIESPSKGWPSHALGGLRSSKFYLWGYKEFCQALGELPVSCDRIWDVKVGHYLLHPDMPDHGLKTSEGLMPVTLLEQSSAVWHAKEAQEAELGDGTLRKLMIEIDQPLSPVLAEMEDYGLAVDRKALEDLAGELVVRIKEVEASIARMAGTKINLNSPKQVGWLLFEKLGLPPTKKTKTGYSTDVAVLEELAKLDTELSEVPKKLLEHRELSKLLSGFAQAILRAIDRESGCVHSTFDHTSTGTGRLSSRDPNIQNIPAYGENAFALRKAFVPHTPDRVFVAGDYSQIELRVLAHLSKEERLSEAFSAGRDIHAETASWVFGVAGDAVTPELRRLAKMINFGLLYGMSSFGLSQRLGIARSEAQRIMERYFQALPKVKDYLERSFEEAKARGYTLSIFGRRRPLGEVSTTEGRGADAMRRVAINTPIQSSAADIAKLAMIEFSRRAEHLSGEARMVLQIHDSIVCECDGRSADEVEEALKETMESAVKLDVPIRAQMKRGKSLAEV